MTLAAFPSWPLPWAVDPQPPVIDLGDLDLAAVSPANVMVTGADRAERTVWARTIHDRSPRRAGPFVVVTGHPQDAVDAVSGDEDVDRWFHEARGGTLFIDHIGDLTLRAQDRLLCLLAERTGESNADALPLIARRVRVIAGSERPLRPALAAGTFREALFYQLNVIHLIRLPLDHDGEQTMTARDIMSRHPATCSPDTDLATVVKIMWDRDCGFVPVVDASGRVAGVLTDRDICIATATRRLLPEHLTAAQVMTTPVQTCRAGDSIREVLATMGQRRIRRVPVVDADGRLEGVLAVNDVVLAARDGREPAAVAIVTALAAICAHRRPETAVA